MMGLTNETTQGSWMMVEKFAGFGFCKAHAATYAGHFLPHVLFENASSGGISRGDCAAQARASIMFSAYVEEAKRWGIEVLLPSVNHSRMEYTVELRRAEKKCCASA